MADEVKKEKVEEGIVEERNDVLYINNEYLTMALYMVAQQFICDPMVGFTRLEDYRERCTYLLRQHCPMAYAYFFEQARLDVLPMGSLMIILDTVRQHNPFFMRGVIE